MQYDYIIVGGGSAGCVMANRLSACGRYTVCLLEAGSKTDSMLVKTPGLFAAHMFTNKFNWAYNAKPSDDIRKGKPLFVPRGKGLGGSSAINAMVYVRGQKEDYDHWESLGNDGWGYDDLLPYFKKSECNEHIHDENHGNSGPLHVSTREDQYPLTEVFLKAGKQVGYKVTEDFNGSSQEGIGRYQFTIKNGERCGVAAGYLKPAWDRDNLSVFTGAQAKRIVIKDKKAVGVEFIRNGTTQEISAKREVILSGGAINSPQILMLSGIGGKAELAKFDINCIKNLPGVGKNLQEHVDACVLVSSKLKDGFTSSPLGLGKMAPEVLKYLSSRTGKLANSMIESGGFLKASPDAQTPDVQYHMAPLLFDDCGRDLKLMSQHGYSLHVCVLRPESRGTVSLASNDVKDAPIIDFKFFSDPKGKDKEVLVNGLKQAREILAAPAFDKHRGEELFPGKGVQSDDQLFEKAKDALGLVYHPVGTCKMGKDKMAVVDTELKVHGINKLRVVDGSVMPTLISGNTNAPIIAIAEKASEMMLSE